MATTPGLDSNPLVINEFVAANNSGIADEDGDHSDWLELYNQSDQPVNLGSWALTNDPAQPTKWPLPDITLGSRQYLVVFASGKNRRAIESGAALHTNFKLNKAGGFLALYNIVDDRLLNNLSAEYPQQFDDIAYGRYGPDLTFGYLSLPTPGGTNNETDTWGGLAATVRFSVTRGFQAAPFWLTLTTATPDVVIRYTTDGSEPTAVNGSSYTEPIFINKTTSVRAVAFKPEFLPSSVTTHTYIFLDDVIRQPAALPGFPTSWGAHLAEYQGVTTAASIPADYEMDPRLANDPAYQAALKTSLTSLPVVSLVMDTQHFANLYANPDKQGRAAEHPVSVEIIEPDAVPPEIQLNAGIRLHNDKPSMQFAPKRSLQLYFRNDYGASMLEYPLFPDSSALVFDTLLLQAGLNDVPVGSSQPPYLYQQWLHQSQLAMSGLGTHSRLAHLYLNGAYWGIYNLTEQVDAQFMASYQGGQVEDWFLATPAGPLNDQATPQTAQLDYLFSMLGHISQATDNRLVAQPTEIHWALKPYLNPAQFSDFVILNWYTQAWNWPQSRWYAAMRTQNPPGQIEFLFGNEPAEEKQDLIINSLFETLMQDPDFKLVFADRLYKHLFNNGALTDTTARQRWLDLKQPLGRAIVGDLGRWGDAYPQAPLSQSEWLKASEVMLPLLAGRATELLAKATELNYYPNFNPPQFSQPGGFVEAGFPLSMSASVGVIYYTTDGADPRLPVTGEVSPTALAYNRPVLLTANTVVKARILVGETWSALQEALFTVVEQDNRLRITEIMYNPIGGDDYEFIELKNSGSGPVNLANLVIDEGIYFTFPPNIPPLAPGGFAVLARKPAAFTERYPNVTITGVYEGSLSNKGERISVKNAQLQPLLEIEYDDRNGWPVSPDGRGDSLILVNVDDSPNNPKNWRASANLYGSPGEDEPDFARRSP